MNEKSWNKLSYGASLRYYNFLGRNIYLKFKTVFGFNPLYQFIYHNPWFLGNNKLYSKLIIFKRKVRSKSPDHKNFEDSRIGFDWMIGKRFGHFTFTGIDFKYTEISASPDKGLTASSSGKDRLLSITGSFGYDNRDLKEYPHDGWWLKIYGKVSGKKEWLPYYQYGFDARRFIPFSPKWLRSQERTIRLYQQS